MRYIYSNPTSTVDYNLLTMSWNTAQNLVYFMCVVDLLHMLTKSILHVCISMFSNYLFS